MAITYDAIGNPTKWRNAVSLTWEGRDLRGITLSSGSSASYSYNSDGATAALAAISYLEGK